MLQRISVRHSKTKREFVLVADLIYTINQHGDTTTQTVIPSFSAVICKIEQTTRVCMIVGIILLQFEHPNGSYQGRLRFIVAPMRSARIPTYLPYDVVEHDAANGGVMLTTISAADIIDTHFLMPIFGLRHMWTDLSTLPDASTYNQRSGQRGYFSLPYARFDVASSSWTMTASSYPTTIAEDRDPINKVFVTQAELAEAQTSFGFDEEVDELALRGIGSAQDVAEDEASYEEEGVSDSDSDSSVEDDSD